MLEMYIASKASQNEVFVFFVFFDIVGSTLRIKADSVKPQRGV